MAADPPDSPELQRLRERVELQFHQLRTLSEALGARGGSRVVTIRPVLQPRSEGLEEGIPPANVTSWWPGSEWPVEPLVPTPGLGSLSLAGRAVPVIAVIVYGLVGPGLEAVVEMVATRQRRSGDFKPVFLTDSPSFRPFQARGFVVEYLSRALYGADPHRLRNARAAARLKFLQAKWDFGGVIDLTRGASALSADAIPIVPGEGGGIPEILARPLPDDLPGRVAMVRDSGLFDEEWYRSRYPDVSGDAIEHYLAVGAALGHDPHPLFRTAYYLRQLLARAGT